MTQFTLSQFCLIPSGQRHQACVGVVEGKTRGNTFLPTRLVTT